MSTNTKVKVAGLYAMAAMLNPESLSHSEFNLPQTSQRRSSTKPQLTKKQQKVRAKNKAAKQSRKKNRK